MYQTIIINGYENTRKILHTGDYKSCHDSMWDFAIRHEMVIKSDEVDTYAEKIIKITENIIYMMFVIIEKI